MSFTKLIWHSMRDNQGTLLKYKAITNAKSITDKTFQEIKSLKTYKNTNHKFNRDLFDIYLKKELFEKIIHITTQIEIIKYEINVNKSSKAYSINLCGLNFKNLRKIINFEFSKKNIFITNHKLENMKLTSKLYYRILSLAQKNSAFENIFYKLFNFLEFIKISILQFNLDLPLKK